MSVSTRDALMKSAEIHLRTKGYAAFSYADLAEEIGIRKASIHHHFPTKENLGHALITRYIEGFTQKLRWLDETHADPVVRLREFSLLFQSSIHDRLLPLCGALAAEMAAMPESLQELGRALLTQQLAWLEKSLVEAAKVHRWKRAAPPALHARMLLSALEGASFIDWALGSSAEPLATFNHLLDTVS